MGGYYSISTTHSAVTRQRREPSPAGSRRILGPSLRSGRHRFPCLLPYRFWPSHAWGGVETVQSGAYTAELHRPRLSLHVLRVWLARVLVGERHVPALPPDWGASGLQRPRPLESHQHPPNVPRLHLRFFLDQMLYLNHFYLMALISFLMIFVPAHRAFSVDA
jgi:hypothetical protein